MLLISFKRQLNCLFDKFVLTIYIGQMALKSLPGYKKYNRADYRTAIEFFIKDVYACKATFSVVGYERWRKKNPNTPSSYQLVRQYPKVTPLSTPGTVLSAIVWEYMKANPIKWKA
ncbi:hypothetical protein CCAX7_46320 [Capsulimonas corticalis]|uniref:Uncharacterized protein n=1 Tax=Capsulimonas corticalis TaxID=2219043 RepID=A0A9N7L6D6_9BACT|nr:hypothetical protein CCAX7_46320 [Capsulimonas corticalis]